MNLQSKRELEVTRKKLQELEKLYAKTEADSSQSAYSRDLTLRSLRRTVNQLKEEIARFEAHTSSTATDK
jgi:5-bromo-4-chloroindolyl phosphate hydrolysis protein